MSKTYFRDYQITKSTDKETLVVSDFLGVDYSESQINLPNNKATDMVNIMDIDGVNQVRDGFEIIANIPSEEYTYKGEAKKNPNNINAVWRFKNYLIIHVGRLLYVCDQLDDYINNHIYMLVGNNNEPYFELENIRTSAFIGKYGLYILGGNGYYLLTEELELIDLANNTEYTYIPTTMTAITSVGSGVASRNALDDFNLLTEWQKNKLITGHENTGNELYYEYELAAPIKAKDDEDLNAIKVSVLTTEVR